MPIRKSNDTLFYLIGIIPVVWLALLLAQSLGGGLPELLRNLTSALEQPTNIVWTDKSLPTILICLAAYGMAVLLYRTNQGRTRDGEEHGSAAWATPASVNAQFAQKESIPLTQHVRLGLDTHRHRRSLNVLVIGGSGAAKTRSFVLPNILTANTNYVITDPKSEVLLATGGYLKEQGYDVRVLNLVNLEQSDGYNPFRYLRDEKDVLKLVNNLIQSTTPKGSHESDPFWTKAETALLQAIILMLFQEAPEYEQNFSMVMRVLEYAEVREENEGHVSPLDLLFESIERRKMCIRDSQWAGWIWRGIAVWDKGNSRPQKGRFRQQAEYIVWGSNGDMPVSRPVPCLPGVFKYGNPQNRIHLTEKPLQLMQDLVKITEPGGHILDPFAGSGTTVLAAVKEGYDATGIEVTDVYADLARKRLESELNAA